LTLSNRQRTTSYDQLQQTTSTVPQACRANQTRGRDLKEPDTRQQARHEAGPGARHEACARWTITKTVWKDLALLRLSWIPEEQSLKDIRLRNHHQTLEQLILIPKHQIRRLNVTRVTKRLGQIRRLYPKPHHTKRRYRRSTRSQRSTSITDQKDLPRSPIKISTSVTDQMTTPSTD
jgi:hypothetical protein